MYINILHLLWIIPLTAGLSFIFSGLFFVSSHPQNSEQLPHQNNDAKPSEQEKHPEK